MTKNDFNKNIETYVINLSSATDRWHFQQKQLNALDISFCRFDAINISEINEDEYEKWANHWQRKLRKTEVACFLSHYMVWQEIAEKNVPVLVLEDDAILSYNVKGLLTKLNNMSNLPFDYLNLETRGRKKITSKSKIFQSDSISIHQLFLDRNGSAGYILTPKGAAILLKYIDNHGAGLTDSILSHNKYLNKMQTIPALIIQMDMIAHYGVDLPSLQQASNSHISNANHSKPNANSMMDNLGFKYRRISAQAAMGITQLKYRNELYDEIKFDNEGLEYLKTMLTSEHTHEQ